MGGLVLALGAGTALWATLGRKAPGQIEILAMENVSDNPALMAHLPAGQIQPQSKGYPAGNSKCPPECTREVEIGRIQAQYPFRETALQKLQWLADESRCHVSDNPALMAGCVRERIAKVRAKALAYKERYEALRDLDRVYFGNLHREGLVPYTTHVPKDVLEQALR